jgi:GNAT superfamily N-acetyltransferase
MKIVRTNSENIDFKYLIKKLDEDLWSRNNSLQHEYDRYNKLENIQTVLLVYDSDKPVGCGCFRLFNEKSVEIKRMYVVKEHRGKGISKIILNELEKWALEIGFESAVLETGHNQFEAVGLYSRLGYQKIDNFGQYAFMPNSICFKKILQPVN